MQQNFTERRKKRILVPIVGQGSIIHIIRTGMLDKLSSFCEPVICLLWNQPDLISELQDKGYEVHLIPDYNVSPEYTQVRTKIDFWYRKYKVKTPSVNIQKNYVEFFNKKTVRSYKKELKEALLHARLKLQPAYIKTLLRIEAASIRKQSTFAEYEKWINGLKIEGMFTVTPFLNEADLIARILREKGGKLIASIHSFDNVTKRGWASTFFDHYVVWNKYNKSELERIHPQLKKDEAVTVAGAAQFDFHFNQHFRWTREAWLQKLNLPQNKKIILYAGGSITLLPDEPQYLVHLHEAFEKGEISNDSVVLFRCHPLDKKERWIKHIGNSKHIYFDESPHGEKKLDQVNVVEDDIKRLMSTLSYTDVHINVVSTMSVDGSAFNKPQIGPYYDEVNPKGEKLFRRMYYQEHYLPIMRSEVVTLAKSKEEFISTVNSALASPEKFNTKSRSCIEEIVTYSDGQSTIRAVDAIKKFLQ